MYELLDKVAGPALRIALRLRVEGREHLPVSGAVLLASSHLSITA